MKRNLKDILIRRLKNLLKDIYCLPVDSINLLLGKRDEFTPPKRLIFVGGGDFRKTGDEFFKYFIELAGLKPDHNVLDVGCGIGRMAVPLTKYLTKGNYKGIDIIDRGIKWSNKVIAKKYSNFHFQLADVYNKLYNPSGNINASEYRFPFEDESFDIVFLTSVFTHMLPPDLENYFSEISRVLKKKGRTLITYFLMNNNSRELIEKNLSSLNFNYKGEGYWTISIKEPEIALAYNEEYIKNLYSASRMQIITPIYYGSWCGRKDYLSYQDIVIAVKN